MSALGLEALQEGAPRSAEGKKAGDQVSKDQSIQEAEAEKRVGSWD
jgi:hypothetical protein